MIVSSIDLSDSVLVCFFPVRKTNKNMFDRKQFDRSRDISSKGERVLVKSDAGERTGTFDGTSNYSRQEAFLESEKFVEIDNLAEVG